MDLAKFLNKRICVAVSGGVDSMTLLHYVKTQAQGLGITLLAVHCEHGIRGKDSLADCNFVQNVCKEWNIPLIVFSENCLEKAKKEKSSVETAARNFRHDCFSKLIAENKADYIATAHHQGDEAETVLFRLARGTSLTGVQGMTEENGYLIRPILDWPKEKIEAYALEHQLSYCVDQTNFERDATRNKLRLDIMPMLENAVPGAGKNISKFARIAKEDDELLYELASELLQETEDGFCVCFSEKPPLFRRACLLAIKALGIEQDYTQTHLDSVFALQKSERGARICLPNGLIAIKSEKGIDFTYLKEEIFPEKPPIKIFDKKGFDGGRYAVNVVSSLNIKPESGLKILRIDGQKLPQDAVFRFRQDGDEMQVFGGMRKTLKKIFNEKKIPVLERGYLPLIAEKDGKEVYAICGIEISDALRITDQTQEILYITTEKKR